MSKVVIKRKDPMPFLCKYCGSDHEDDFKYKNKSTCASCISIRSKIERGTAKKNDPLVIAFCRDANIDIDDIINSAKETTNALSMTKRETPTLNSRIDRISSTMMFLDTEIQNRLGGTESKLITMTESIDRLSAEVRELTNINRQLVESAAEDKDNIVKLMDFIKKLVENSSHNKHENEDVKAISSLPAKAENSSIRKVQKAPQQKPSPPTSNPGSPVVKTMKPPTSRGQPTSSVTVTASLSAKTSLPVKKK